MMCTNPPKEEFDILCQDLVQIDDMIKAWLEVESKEKQALSYNYGGHCYDNMITNLLKIFNDV